MNTLLSAIACSLTPCQELTSTLAPLFWQHGESDSVLREEMRQMRSVGIRECIMESRPHPDFLGPKWWESVDTVLDEAQRLGMRVWFFDDSAYPSGFGAGRIRDRHPELLKVYLAQRAVDARGPLKSSWFHIAPWLADAEQLVAVVAARRVRSDGDELDPATLLDLTGRVRDGRLAWDVPEGWWRVFILVRTREGGEVWTKDYLNPLLSQAVDAYLEAVHQEHYNRYREHFGKTIAGFFTDEPRFGNAGTYDGAIGRCNMVLPWSDDLLTELDGGEAGDFRRMLPTLWHDAGEEAHRTRYRFMDVVSRRFGENFTGRIGQWCRQHGVQLIGHVVEDNNAHARLGYGAGHFFRALQGQDTSGLDMVYQVWPRQSEGRMLSPWGSWDMTFFYWGIAKLAASLAHLDPSKHGRTMCEIFGAYGWQLGLGGMKFLTDHACVRGVNFLVPHAFSPKFPDDDCPPHFYARGHNPQWRHFGVWSAYASRVCHLLTGGDHVAAVAVLYHAEAEWAGECEHFQHAVKALAQRQIDCDVVPIDMLIDDARVQIADGQFEINRERFAALVVPYARRLPTACLRRIAQLLEAGVAVVFTQGLPSAASDSAIVPSELETIGAHRGVSVCKAQELPDLAAVAALADVTAQPACEHLRIYRYLRDEMELLFCVNEDPQKAVDTTLELSHRLDPIGYDAMDDSLMDLRFTRTGDRLSIHLHLPAGASLFVAFGEATHGLGLGGCHPQARRKAAWTPLADAATIASLAGPWQVTLAPLGGEPLALGRDVGLGDLTQHPQGARFAGIVAYETTFRLARNGGDCLLDLGELYHPAEVFLDGKSLGARICGPFTFTTPDLAAGEHRLKVELAPSLAYAKGHNALDRCMPQEPLGLLGPVRILATTQRPWQSQTPRQSSCRPSG